MEICFEGIILRPWSLNDAESLARIAVYTLFLKKISDAYLLTTSHL